MLVETIKRLLHPAQHLYHEDWTQNLPQGYSEGPSASATSCQKEQVSSHALATLLRRKLDYLATLATGESGKCSFRFPFSVVQGSRLKDVGMSVSEPRQGTPNISTPETTQGHHTARNGRRNPVG